MKGISGITKRAAALTIPPDTPPDEVWRYGLGFPFQVAPTKVGLFCNVRRDGTNSIDLEIGSDVVLFDDLASIRAEDAMALSRYELGESFIVRKGPILGGFVPLGAKLVDGGPHPHAGTGFGLAMGARHELDETGNYDYRADADRHAEMFQFGYDGREFKILKREYVKVEGLLSEWDLAGNFVTNAIPDGQGLLYVMIAKVGGRVVAGVTRWECGAAGWRPVSFVPVTGNEAQWGEPSLIRDGNGDLLFSARSDCSVLPGIAFDAAVWRSTDNGKTWEQVIYRKDCRSRSPVSINQAADGTPFLAANLPPHDRTREVLGYWPLNESRTDFEELRIARDLPAEFGPAPSGSWWRIDHPNSAIVRLADGAWHGLLAYRVVDNGEVEGDADPPPQTGCYVEEVISSGEAIPTWYF